MSASVDCGGWGGGAGEEGEKQGALEEKRRCFSFIEAWLKIISLKSKQAINYWP
jgi:hypothetical protein